MAMKPFLSFIILLMMVMVMVIGMTAAAAIPAVISKKGGSLPFTTTAAAAAAATRVVQQPPLIDVGQGHEEDRRTQQHHAFQLDSYAIANGVINDTVLYVVLNEADVNGSIAIQGIVASYFYTWYLNSYNALTVIQRAITVGDSSGTTSNALQFSGYDSQTGVNLYGVVGVTSLSVCSWVKPTSDSYFQPMTIVTNQNLGITTGVFWLGVSGASNRAVQFRACYDTTSVTGCVTISTVQPIPHNEWTHICAMIDGDDAKIYLNGGIVTTRVIAGTLQDRQLDVDHLGYGYITGIGYTPVENDRNYLPWIGGIDEAHYVARAITDDEVCYLYYGTPNATYCPGTFASTDDLASSWYECASGGLSMDIMGQDSLLVWYLLDIDDIGTGGLSQYAIDASGNGNHGIWRNIFQLTTPLDETGDAALLTNIISPTDSYYTSASNLTMEYGSGIDVGMLPSTVTAITFCAWISLSSFYGLPTIFSNALDDNQYYSTITDQTQLPSFELSVFGEGNGNLYVYGQDGGNSTYSIYTDVSLELNTPTHVCASGGNGTAHIWINGQLQDTTVYGTVPQELVQLPHGYMIMNIRDVGGVSNKPMVGTIDDVRIYNRTLSNEAVLAVFRCGVDIRPTLADPTVTNQSLYTTAGSTDYWYYQLPFVWSVPFGLNAPTVSVPYNDAPDWMILDDAYGTPYWYALIRPPSDTSDGEYTIVFEALNQYGDVSRANLTVHILTVGNPDNTSLWFCYWYDSATTQYHYSDDDPTKSVVEPTTPVGSLTGTPASVTCGIIARQNYEPCFTSVSSFNVAKTTGGVISTRLQAWITSIVDTANIVSVYSNGRAVRLESSIYAQVFIFGYQGASDGGSVNLTVSLNATRSFSATLTPITPASPIVVNSFIAPTAAISLFTCKPLVVYELDTINCTFSAKRNSVLVYTSRALIIDTLGVPKALTGTDTNWNTSASFSTFTPEAYSTDYTTSIRVGNVTGIYTVGWSTKPYTSVTVIRDTFDFITIDCSLTVNPRRLYMVQQRTRTCVVQTWVGDNSTTKTPCYTQASNLMFNSTLATFMSITPDIGASFTVTFATGNTTGNSSIAMTLMRRPSVTTSLNFTVLYAPDATSTLSCTSTVLSVPSTTTICTSTIRRLNQPWIIPYGALTVTNNGGSKLVVKDGATSDTLSSTFQYTITAPLTISASVPEITIDDSLSTYVITMVETPTTATWSCPSYIDAGFGRVNYTCTIIPYSGSRQIWTRASFFGATIVDASLNSANGGRKSVLISVGSSSVISLVFTASSSIALVGTSASGIGNSFTTILTSNTSDTFDEWTPTCTTTGGVYENMPTSAGGAITTIFNYGTGITQIQPTITTSTGTIALTKVNITVVRNPDATSTIRCRTTNPVSGLSPVYCWIEPRVSGCLIAALASKFSLSIVEGATLSTFATGAAGARLSFTVTPVRLTGMITISEAVTGSTVVLTMGAPGSIRSWANTAEYTGITSWMYSTIKPSATLGRTYDSDTITTATALDTGGSSGNERWASIACYGANCVAATTGGDVYSWGAPQEADPTTSYGSWDITKRSYNARTGAYATLGRVMDGVERHHVAQVAMVGQSYASGIFTALVRTTAGILITWSASSNITSATAGSYLTPWVQTMTGSSYLINSGDSYFMSAQLNGDGTSDLYTWGPGIQNAMGRYETDTTIPTVVSGIATLPVGSRYTHLFNRGTTAGLSIFQYSVAIIDSLTFYGWGTMSYTVDAFAPGYQAQQHASFYTNVLLQDGATNRVRSISGNMELLAVLTTAGTLWIQRWALVMSSYSGDVTSSDWVRFESLYTAFSGVAISHISVGLVRSLFAAKTGGAIYEFTPTTNLYCSNDCDYVTSYNAYWWGNTYITEPTRVTIDGSFIGAVDVLYSDAYQFVAFRPPTRYVGSDAAIAAVTAAESQIFAYASLNTSVIGASAGTAFILSAETFTLSASLVLTASGMTFTGGGATTILNCGGVTCFVMVSGADLVVSALTITNGTSPTTTYSTTSPTNAGVIVIASTQRVVFTDVYVSACSGLYGGVAMVAGILIVTRGVYSENSGDSGGVFYVSTGGSLSVMDTELSTNVAAWGGAIYGASASTVTVTNTQITDNSVITNTSALVQSPLAFSVSTAAASVPRPTAAVSSSLSSFSPSPSPSPSPSALSASRLTASPRRGSSPRRRRHAQSSSPSARHYHRRHRLFSLTNDYELTAADVHQGGGIYCDRCTLTVTDSVLSTNLADQGGGIFQSEGTLTVTDTEFGFNEVSDNGGGLFMEFAEVYLTRVKFLGNTAVNYGGGVYCNGGVTHDLTVATFTYNTAYGDGGGMYLVFCTMVVDDGTFTSNSATNGGAIALQASAALQLRYSTLTWNMAVNRGGAIDGVGYLESVVFHTTFTSNAAPYGGGIAMGASIGEFYLRDVTFASNAANAGGGAYWYGRYDAADVDSSPLPPTSLIAPDRDTYCTFTNNEASHGPDYASQQIRLLIVNTNWSDGYAATSDQLFDSNLVNLTVQLWDYYDQVVTDAAAISLSLVPSTTTASSSSSSGTEVSVVFKGTTMDGMLTTTPIMTRGVWVFGGEYPIGVTYPPGSTASFMIGASQISMYTDVTSVYVRLCVAGEYDTGTVCAPCAKGTYQPNDDTTVCMTCTAGRYQNTAGQTACTSCAAGTFSMNSASSCEDCPEGTYSLGDQALACVSCKAGTFTASTASTSCTTCGNGTFATAGATSCTGCDTNAIALEGAATCKACPVSSTAIFPYTAPACWCNVGYYQVYNSTACAACPTGGDCTSMNTQQMTMPALYGKWPALNKDNTQFLSCVYQASCIGGVPGTECATGYQDAMCNVCSDGYGRKGQYGCGVCPGETQNRVIIGGATVIIVIVCCIFVWSSLRGSREAIRLHARELRTHKKRLVDARATQQQHEVEWALEDLAELHNGLGAARKATHTILLKILFSGIQFNSIARSFEFDWPSYVLTLLNTQQETADVGSNIFSVDCFVRDVWNPFYLKCLLFLILPLIIIVAPWLFFLPYMRRIKADHEKDIAAWNHLKAEEAASIKAGDHHGIDAAERALRRMRTTGPIELQPLPPASLSPSASSNGNGNGNGRVSSPTASPIATSPSSRSGLGLGRRPPSSPLTPPPTHHHQQKEGPLEYLGLRQTKEQSAEARLARIGLMKESPESRGWKASLIDKYTTTVIVCLFLVHPNIATQTFSMFNCKVIGLEDNRIDEANYLLADLSQQCYSTKHLTWLLAVGLPMMILWVIGIPTVAFSLLSRERHNIQNQDPTTMMKYSFLYTGYRLKDRYWWEITIIGRKLLLVCLAVFLSDDVHTQSLLALLLVIILLVAHVYFQPFIDPLMNMFEFVSLLSTFVTFFLGQFLFTTSSSDGRQGISITIVVINLLFLLFGVIMLVWVLLFRANYDQRLDRARRHDQAVRRKRHQEYIDQQTTPIESTTQAQMSSDSGASKWKSDSGVIAQLTIAMVHASTSPTQGYEPNHNTNGSHAVANVATDTSATNGNGDVFFDFDAGEQVVSFHVNYDDDYDEHDTKQAANPSPLHVSSNGDVSLQSGTGTGTCSGISAFASGGVVNGNTPTA